MFKDKTNETSGENQNGSEFHCMVRCKNLLAFNGKAKLCGPPSSRDGRLKTGWKVMMGQRALSSSKGVRIDVREVTTLEAVAGRIQVRQSEGQREILFTLSPRSLATPML
jgi:hypothetical protein